MIACLLIACGKKEKQNPSIMIFDDSLENIINSSAEIEYLVDSLNVAEGPLWDVKSNSLLFTHITENTIYKWNEIDGHSKYITPSGYTNYAPTIPNIGLSGANGLAFDPEGMIILAQHGDRRVAKIKNEKTSSPIFETVTDSYEQKRFNSPNDLVISSNGDIYFTDPTYGFMNLQDWSFDFSVKEIDFSGIYRYNASTGIELISDELDLPNGIALSNDEKFLYVNSSNTAEKPIIIKIDLLTSDSTVFFDGSELASEYSGNFDGLKVHSSGNIFTTGPNGILIISEDGKLLGNVKFKGDLTNCTFDENENYLYVTGFEFVARIKLNT